MGLHKTSMVHGIGAYLEQRGLIGWASEKVASEVYEHIAGQLQGPEQLPAAGLDPVSAYKIAQVITDTHANLARQGFGGDRSLAMQKQAAASNDVETLAIMTAGGLMQKRADAMIMQGGQHTNRAGESPDTLAQLDQMQRPQGQYLTGVGHTDMPDGPSSWSSQPHPIGHTNTVPVSNSITKNAGWLDNPVGRALQQPGLAAGLTGQAAMAGIENMSPWAQRGLGAGAGAALGAGVGAAAADEGHGWQGAGVGALAGGALGAGGTALAQTDTAGMLALNPRLAISDAASSAGNALSGAAHRVGQAPGAAASGWNAMSPEARYAITGGGGGALLGAAGGAAYDEDDRLRGALIGGAGGAALGAGGGFLAGHGINGHALPGFGSSHDAGPMNPMAGNPLQGAASQRGPAMSPEMIAQRSQRNPSFGQIPDLSGYQAQVHIPSEMESAGRVSLGHDISSLLRKIASGGSLTASPKNTASDAAKHDELAALDLKNRAEGKYVGVAGHSSFPNVNQDFHVQHMPGAPKTGPSTVSSREIKSASDMSQDEQIFVHLFNKTASEIGPYLPSNMDVDTKVAHIRAAIGLDNAQRVNYLNAIYGQR